MTCFAAVDLGGQSGRVVLASHDTASAVAAATSSAGLDGVVSCGSWALAGCIAAVPALDERARRAGYTNEASADGRTLLLRNLSGLWLLESCLTAYLMVQAVAAGDFGSLDSARAAVRHDDHGPVLLEPA